jgi:hypothetical protein
MALACGRVVYFRPCRKNDRLFAPKDVRRISGYAKKKHNWLKIALYSLEGMGLLWVVCKLNKMWRAFQGVEGFLKLLAKMATSVLALRLLIEYLRGVRLPFPWIDKALIILTAIIVIITGIADKIHELSSNYLLLNKLASATEKFCIALEKAGGKMDGVADDLIENMSSAVEGLRDKVGG